VQRGHRRHEPGAGDGRARFTYLNNGELHDQGSGDLHFYNVRGRNGHLNNGDSMTFPATLLIKAGGSHDINIITSP